MIEHGFGAFKPKGNYI